MHSNRLANLSSAIEGVHYTIVDGRLYPIVRGGDGPSDEAAARAADEAALAELARLVEQAEGDLADLEAEFDDDGVLVGGPLFELRQALVAGYDETRPSVSNKEQLAAVQRIQAAIATVDARAGVVLQEAQELAAELAALDAQVHGEEAADDDAAAGGDDDGADQADEAPAGDEAPAPLPGDPGTDDAPSDADAPADGRQPVAASSTPLAPPSFAMLRRTQRSPQAPAQAPAAGAENPAMRRVLAYAGLQNVAGSQEFESVDAIGRELAALAGSVQVPNPTGRKHYVGKIPILSGPGTRIVNAEEHRGLDDEGIIDLAVRRNTELRRGAATLQASGGPCAPPQIDYSISLIGDRGAPFVGSLPTIVSNRPISYYPWIEFDMADVPLASGIGFVTAAQDTAGYGGTNPLTGDVTAIPGGGVKFKDCIKIDCPTPVTCSMEMIYRCISVGRFVAQAFPEYVRVFDEFTGIYFDIARDERAIGAILAAAKTITAGPATFGSTVDTLGMIRQLAAHIRSARHAPNLAIEVRLPEWDKYRLANDIAATFAQSTDNLRITPDQALGLIGATEGILVDTYNVSAGTTTNGSPTVLPLPTNGNPLPEFPNEVRILAWAEGAVFHRAGSEVSFGLQEVGMMSNDFSTFMETEENTCVRGSDVYAIDIQNCDNGARGAAVAVTCGPQAGATNEVQYFDPGDATGGTVGVSWDGAGPVQVPYNASASAAVALLETLPNINEGDITANKVGTRTYLQFTGQYAGTNVPEITVSSAALTGGAATATKGTVTVGG